MKKTDKFMFQENLRLIDIIINYLNNNNNIIPPEYYILIILV